MLKIYTEFWTRVFDYSGRSDTTDFWVPMIFNFLFLFLLLPFLAPIIFSQQAQTVQLFGLILGLIFLIPTLSLETRRLRDAGLPLALLGLEVVRFVGAVLGIGYLSLVLDILLLVAMTRPTKVAS